MAYFNLNIEKIKKIKEIKRDFVFVVLKVVAIFVLAGVVAAIILLQRQETGDKGRDTGYGRQETSEEEKIRILESLSAPADAPRYTNEEKKKILESLSAPEDSPRYTEEEKKRILESLSAPQ